MENVRLIYEQIEHAKRMLLSESILDLRLSLILLDNAAEVMMYRELSNKFRWDDNWTPQWMCPEDLPPELRPKYTKEERDRAEREFEPLIRLLRRFDKLSESEAAVLRVCHKMRVDAFHRAEMNNNIFLPTTKLLFLTVADMTLKFRAGHYTEPRGDDGPDAQFLKRFGLKSAHSLFQDEGLKAMRAVLVRDVNFDPQAFSNLLAEDLEERIEGIIGNIGEMNNTEDDAKIDEILQHVEFWRERGAAVAKECSERHEAWGPAVDQAFAEWKENPGPKYTVPKLRRWIQHAAALRRSTNSPHVLSRYWGIQNMFLDLEDRVIDALVKFDIENG
jgi:hypothetical protein